MKKTPILISIMLALIMLLVASEVRAQLATPVTLSRTCTTTSLGTAVAGPCLSGMTGCTNGLAPEFPRVVNCPDECDHVIDPATSLELNGQFLRWDIKFTGLASPSLVGTQVAADVRIEAAIGTTDISEACYNNNSLGVGLNDCDSRWIKFPGNSSGQTSFLASYFTKAGFVPRPEGVVFKSGKSLQSCLLAGAGKQVTDPHKALNIQVVTNYGPCLFYRTLDSEGYTIDLQLAEGSPCTVSITSPVVNNEGVPASYIPPGTEITWGPASCVDVYQKLSNGTYAKRTVCTP